MLVEDELDRVMPSRRSVMAAGRYDLHHAIQYHGGYTQVLPSLLHLAKALPIQPKWPAHAQVCCLRHQHHQSSLGQEWQPGAMTCTIPSNSMAKLRYNTWMSVSENFSPASGQSSYVF